MVLRKLSQTLRISLAFMLAILSTGILQVAPVYAVAGAANDAYTVDENSTTDLDVTDNDSGDQLEVTSVSNPANGTASIHSNKKSAIYTPDTDYVGSDSFTYALKDKKDNTTSTATVSITVEGEAVVEQTCDDLPTVTPGINGWTTKFDDPAGYPDTVVYNAPTGFLVDMYCVKAGSTQQGNGPITVPVTPASATVTVDYPNKDSISHYVVHLVQIQGTTQTLVSPVAPTVTDVCGTVNDSIVLPTDTDQITYSRNGAVVTAALVNPSTHDFGTTLNGYMVAGNGLTAALTIQLPGAQPCLTPAVCEAPTNGGVITQNTAGWTIYGDTEFIENGLELSSNEWSGSYIKSNMSYMISNALQLGWTVEGTVDGAGGSAIIFKTASGANVHYEPEPYSDDFWTNTPGILPANAGGQGGPYSGSLQDLLDTGGDQSIVATYFYFNSATENTIVLKSLSFNCKTFTFNKEGEVLNDNDKKIEICHATSSVVNPYNKISVSTKAADGIAGNSGGQPDHYGEHTGAIFNPATDVNGGNWGDIIPPITGVHSGLNWTTQGQAIYNNGGCEYVAPVDFCPLVPGVQSDTTLCPGGRGGVNDGGQTLGASTNTTPQTLGAAVLPAVLPSTGASDSPLMILAAALLAYGAAYFLQGRRLLGRKEALSA